MAQDTGSSANPAPPAASASDGTGGIEEIVVTANRFEETAQKTPLILSVIGAEDLKGVTDIRQLATIDPGVQLSVGGGLPQTIIRGVGSAVVLTGQESSVSYNADGVFLFSPLMVSPLMYDIERIEVLKGPQGTLYGRGASGGALNIITTGAKLNTTEGFVEGEIGNFSRWRGTAAVNLPLGETLAVRFAGQHVEHDGYLSDGTDDQKMTSGRVRLLWEPSSTVSLRVGGDISHQGGKGAGTSINPNPTNDKWIGGLDPRLNPPVFDITKSLLASPPFLPPFVDNDQWSVNAQLDVDLGFATLTVLPAYRHVDAAYRDYGPGFQDGQQFETKERTIEARLANRSDALTWVLGAYYINNDQHGVSNVKQDLVGAWILGDQTFKLRSYAFFGEATFSVTDSVRLIGGLRYTHEKTRIFGFSNDILPPSSPNFSPFNPVTNPTGDFGDFSSDATRSDNAITWKGGAEFDLSPSSLLFATVSKGFKGGGGYLNVPGQPNSFKPEYVTAFELGSRNRFLDNTLQINAELFYWKLKGQQHTFLTLNPNSTITLATVNAGKAHMYGGSLDVVWKPTPHDRLHGAVEYTKSKYDEFIRTVPAAFVFPTTVCDIGAPTPDANLPPFLWPTDVNCTGMPVVRAPKWVATAEYERRFDVGAEDQIVFNGDMTYGSGRWTTIQFTPLSYQKGYAFFNASLAYEAKSVNATITAWIRNIADKRVMMSADALLPVNTRPTLAPPRTFGATIRYNF